MNNIWHIFLILSWILLTSQTDAQRIIKTIDLQENSSFQDFITLSDHSIIALVNESDSLYNRSFYLTKLSPEGNVIWSSSRSEGFGLFLKQIDKACFVGGSTLDTYYEIGILNKYDFDGNLLWMKKYSDGFVSSMIKTNTGKYYIGGNLDYTGSSSDSFLYRINKKGDIEIPLKFDLYSNSSLECILEDGENLILIFNASTVGVGFDGHVIIKLNTSTSLGTEIWRFDKDLGYYKEGFPSWSVGRYFGADINANNELVISGPNYDNSLIYRVSNEGEFIDEFVTSSYNSGTHTHDIIIMDNGDYLLSGIHGDELFPSSAFIERRQPSGEVIWRRYPTTGTFTKSKLVQDTIFLVGLNEDFNYSDSYKPLFVKMTSDGKLYNQDISIKILEDRNEECIEDSLDVPMEEIKTRIEKQIAYTDQEGKVSFNLDTGVYNLILDLPPYLSLCETDEDIVVSTETEFIEYNRLVQTNDCKELSVGLTFTELIRCQTNRIYIQYENASLQTITDVKIKLQIDEALELKASSNNYSEVNGFYEFDIAHLSPLTAKRIWLDIYTPCKTNLFSIKCLDVSIEPKLSCDINYNNWDGPDLNLSALCVDGIATITVVNDSEDKNSNVEYQVFSDGYKFEEDSFLLMANEKKTFLFEPQGNTISFILFEDGDFPFNKTESIALEGCGQQSNGMYSKGFKPMLDSPYNTSWKSKACLEVRDHYSKHRIFQINRGLGFYRIIDPKASTYQFALRYKNDLNKTIQKLNININPNSQFNRNSFKELASSHNVNFAYNSTGEIVITAENLNLGIGEEFHYRFEYDLPAYEIEANRFAEVIASGTVNEDQRIEINEAFHNLIFMDPNQSDTISPYTVMDNGFLFGRGHTMEFYDDMALMNNGNILIAGVTRELTMPYYLYLIMNNNENQVLWEKSYQFDEGTPILYKTLPIGDDQILLLGAIDDANIPRNYYRDLYAYLMVIDKDGEEVWKKVWKPGKGAYAGGAITNGIFTSNEKIIVGGGKYVGENLLNFIMEIDMEGNELWQNNLVFGDGAARYWFPMKADSNQIIIGTIERDSLGESCALIRLDEFGNEINNGKYYYKLFGTNSNITIYDFEPMKNNQIALVANGYFYGSDTNFGRIILLDEEFLFNDSIDVFHDLNILSMTAFAAQDSFIYVGGDWLPDTTFNVDAFMAKLNFNGDIEWFTGKDLGARDYSEDILLGEDNKIYHSIQTQTLDNIYNLQMGYWMIQDQDTTLITPTEQDTTLTTSTEQVTNSLLNYKLSPNPASKLINIEGNIEIEEVMVFSMNGKKNKLFAQSNNTYDVSFLNNGVYLLVIRDKMNKRHYHKFIKISSRN